MNLRYTARPQSLEPCANAMCWLAINAGRDVVIWPQKIIEWPEEIVEAPEFQSFYGKLEPPTRYTLGIWRAYIDATGDDEVRSGHRNINTCASCWSWVGITWIEIARDEVELAKACDAYYERTV